MSNIEILLTSIAIIISVAAFIVSFIALCLQFRAAFPKIILSVSEGKTYYYVDDTKKYILLKFDLENVSAYTAYINDVHIRFLKQFKLTPLTNEKVSSLSEDVQKKNIKYYPQKRTTI